MREISHPWSTGHGYHKILELGVPPSSLVLGCACQMLVAGGPAEAVLGSQGLLRAGPPLQGLATKGQFLLLPWRQTHAGFRELCWEWETKPVDVASKFHLKTNPDKTQNKTIQVILSRNRLI